MGSPGAPPSTGNAGQGGLATLQGWSVVDNTTGADWNNVQLSLIAGAPQSFIQPLSQPIYSRRPEIPIAQEAQLTPQTHDSGFDVKMMKEEAATTSCPGQLLRCPVLPEERPAALSRALAISQRTPRSK